MEKQLEQSGKYYLGERYSLIDLVLTYWERNFAANIRREFPAIHHCGSLAPETHEFRAGDFRACDGMDPEGNIFQVRESVL